MIRFLAVTACLSRRNVGTCNVARAPSPARQHGHARPRSLWRGYALSFRPWSLRDYTRPPPGAEVLSMGCRARLP